MKEYRVAELMPSEKGYLSRAQHARTVRAALEEYARLWDMLDSRLGSSNEATGFYVEEFKERRSSGELEEPEGADVRRVELMEASFLYKRLYPPEIARILFNQTVFKR